jgi:hypothetical protein
MSSLQCSGCAIFKWSPGPGDKLSDSKPADNMEEAGECVPSSCERTFISESGTFEAQDCQARCLTDKVIMLKSSLCRHCTDTEPDFLAACEEHGVTPLILDLTHPDDFLFLDSLGIDIIGTPVFIIGCDYYVGSMDSKEDYLEVIDIFLSK